MLKGLPIGTKTVVTVLVGSQPVCIVETRRIADDQSESDVFYPEGSDLSEVVDTLSGAVSSVRYFLWKTTNCLPPPPDMSFEEEAFDADPPF